MQNGGLEHCKAMLESVNADLDRAPRHLHGTEWFTDRVREKEWLERSIARMTAARRAKAELN